MYNDCHIQSTFNIFATLIAFRFNLAIRGLAKQFSTAVFFCSSIKYLYNIQGLLVYSLVSTIIKIMVLQLLYTHLEDQQVAPTT